MADPTQQTIEQKLYQTWRQQRRFCHVRGASRLVVWLIVLILLDFLIDWGIVFRSRLGINTGVALLAINVVVLGWVLWRHWLRHLRPFDPVLVSLDVEAKNPDLASLLVSYSQLRTEAPNQPDVSVELIAAMRQQAVVKTRPIDFREIIDFSQLKSLLLVTGTALLVFAGMSINWNSHFEVLMQRMLGSSQAYPTQTKVESVTGHLTIKAGDSATIVAGVSGLIPDGGRIFTRPAQGDGDWSEAPLTRRGGQAEFSRDLAEVGEDLIYYVRIGDDQSDEYRISVVAAPQIESVDVAMNYPSYMNKPAGKSDQLNLESVPEGTQLNWTVVTRAPVEKLQVIVVDESSAKPRPVPSTALAAPVVVQKDATGKRLSFSLKASANLKYAFLWTRRADDGQEFEYADVQHNVRVSPDEIPQVELVRPGSNGLATDKKSLKLQVKAFDDHGLSKAWLVYSINASEEKRVQIHDFAGAPSGEFSYVWPLKQSIPELELGMQISFAIEIVDHYPEQLRHVNRSATRQLTIVDQERYLQWYREELAAQQEEIKRARSAEALASEKVKQIKEQESAPK